MFLAPYDGHQVEYTDGPDGFGAACTCGWSGSWPDVEVRGRFTGAHLIGVPEAAL